MRGSRTWEPRPHLRCKRRSPRFSKRSRRRTRRTPGSIRPQRSRAQATHLVRGGATTDGSARWARVQHEDRGGARGLQRCRHERRRSGSSDRRLGVAQVQALSAGVQSAVAKLKSMATEMSSFPNYDTNGDDLLYPSNYTAKATTDESKIGPLGGYEGATTVTFVPAFVLGSAGRVRVERGQPGRESRHRRRTGVPGAARPRSGLRAGAGQRAPRPHVGAAAAQAPT